MKAKIQLGELLIAKQIVSKEQINEALRIQVSGNRRLGSLLIKMGFITEEQLLDILSEQLELPIINVDNEFTPQVKGLLPRYLCRKYNVLPLQIRKDNIITLAMADPLDDEAINNVENFTAMVVKPCLAQQQHISKAINQYVPFSVKEIFHLLTLNHAVKFISTVAVILLLTTSVILVNYIYHEQYGTISKTDSSVVFKNHDLMLELNKNGKISLLGRAVRSEGYYAVTFDKIETLNEFIAHKKNDFSEKQAAWLQWVIKNRIEKKVSTYRITSSS
ncbi:MAG: hypothetical protein PHZ02_14770 [Desulfocapsaceae bacterium]|nr:hypothetical protein [Desulfocapsaceae bacterium]